MNDITKIKVDGATESSYKLFPKNREFEKRAGGNTGSQSGVQPDWNQNDETQPDYVKNRPFYTGDPVETVLLEESILSFINPEGSFYYSAIPTTIELTVGETYKVSWDGATYERVCESIRGSSVIGNPSIMGAGADTGDPFLISPLANDHGTEIYTKDASASHTISISGIVESITKIGAKYIPELPYMDKFNPTGAGSFSLNRKSNTTVGQYSFAECRDTTASGLGSHAEGYDTTASGEYSHAEGSGTTASSLDSHAEGSGTTASSTGSHAEGYSTTASGLCSHAEGYGTTASGEYSHAGGYGTKASSKYQHVRGKYNIEDTSNTYAEIVGNGEQLKNSNAHTLDWSGNAWFAGTIEGKAIILPSSTEGSTKRFKITVDDSGALTATEVT